MFRALILDYQPPVDADNPSKLQFWGVYCRCDDLYFSFPRYELPKRAIASDIPMHFIVDSLMAEALRLRMRWKSIVAVG